MKEKAKKKRQQIIDAALCVFLQNGYEKTKIIDIAQEAGIGKGTVYEYFDSKEALFHCLLNTYCQYYKETVQNTLSKMDGHSSREKLLAIMNIEHRLQEDVGLKSMNPIRFQMEFSHFPGLKQAIFTMIEFKFDTLRRILNEGIDSGELRSINPSMATIIFMSACEITFDAAKRDYPPNCQIADGDLNEFTDENFLDLIMHGFCAS